ncbi:hypothetical protein [Streptomyces sp. TP-A0356]|uniref:hypothetical protein n=1 Tax=Streptomyces sp. TP-A0356 TaxID=1359208 RepID=UPI0006E411FF|nr:hypothetical protein [Streptomyces sp. TP-A0356]
MRCRARVLSAAALAGAAVGALAAPASADPSADVSPRSVAPGGTVTISVSCDAMGGTLPDTIEAASQGFEEGKIRLRRVDGIGGAGEGKAGVLYSGTARAPAAGSVGGGADPSGRDQEWGIDGRCPVAPSGRDKVWNASFTVSREGSGRQGEGDGRQPAKQQGEGDGRQQGETPGRLTGEGQGRPPREDDGRQPGKQQGEGQGKQQGEGQGKQQGENQGGHQGKQQGESQGRQDGERPPVGSQHGVNAGEGGAFNESVPALVTGCVLIAGAFGAAVHRVWRRRPSGGG